MNVFYYKSCRCRRLKSFQSRHYEPGSEKRAGKRRRGKTSSEPNWRLCTVRIVDVVRFVCLNDQTSDSQRGLLRRQPRYHSFCSRAFLIFVGFDLRFPFFVPFDGSFRGSPGRPALPPPPLRTCGPRAVSHSSCDAYTMTAALNNKRA